MRQAPLSILKSLVGVVIYAAMAFVLPVIAPLLGVHSNVPASWGALAYPFLLIPFLMGYASPLFEARGLLRLSFTMIALVAVVACVNAVVTTTYVTETLFFYVALLAGFAIFSRLGLMTSQKLKALGHRQPEPNSLQS